MYDVLVFFSKHKLKQKPEWSGEEEARVKAPRKAIELEQLDVDISGVDELKVPSVDGLLEDPNGFLVVVGGDLSSTGDVGNECVGQHLDMEKVLVSWITSCQSLLVRTADSKMPTPPPPKVSTWYDFLGTLT